MKMMAFFVKIILIVILLLSGVGKFLSPLDAEKVLILILDLNKAPDLLTRYIIYVISLSEQILAFGLILTKKKFWAYLTLIIFTFFTISLISLPLRGIIVPYCGCFGSIIPDGNLLSAIIKNIIFILINLYYIYEVNFNISDEASR
jgi:hypothetical protein